MTFTILALTDLHEFSIPDNFEFVMIKAHLVISRLHVTTLVSPLLEM